MDTTETVRGFDQSISRVRYGVVQNHLRVRRQFLRFMRSPFLPHSEHIFGVERNLEWPSGEAASQEELMKVGESIT